MERPVLVVRSQTQHRPVVPTPSVQVRVVTVPRRPVPESKYILVDRE